MSDSSIIETEHPETIMIIQEQFQSPISSPSSLRRNTVCSLSPRDYVHQQQPQHSSNRRRQRRDSFLQISMASLSDMEETVTNSTLTGRSTTTTTSSGRRRRLQKRGSLTFSGTIGDLKRAGTSYHADLKSPLSRRRPSAKVILDATADDGAH